ncbi:MAG: hypothetical protein WC650_01500 [Candidatus Doudnabacteria bacterium]
MERETKQSWKELGHEKREKVKMEREQKKAESKESWALKMEKMKIAWGKAKNFGKNILRRVVGAKESALDMAYASPDMAKAGLETTSRVVAGAAIGGVELGRKGIEKSKEGVIFLKDKAIDSAGAVQEGAVSLKSRLISGKDDLNDWVDEKYGGLKGMVGEGYDKVMDGKDRAAGKLSEGMESARNFWESWKQEKEQKHLSERLKWVDGQLKNIDKEKESFTKEREEILAIMELSSSLEGLQQEAT